MSAAASWEAAHDRLPPEIQACLESSGEAQLRSLELLLAVPEWEVPLPGGETSSHTDVLAVARNDVALCANDSETPTPIGNTVEEEGGEVTRPWRRSG